MKTFYLAFWVLNAILLLNYGPNYKDFAVLYIFNVVIPISLLIVRLILIHIYLDESKIDL